MSLLQSPELMHLMPSRISLQTLLEEYAQQKNSEFGQKETDIMTGALNFEHKTVGTCMTPIEEVFMIDMDDALDFEKLMEIFQSGHSRVPVYQKDAEGHKVPPPSLESRCMRQYFFLY